MTDGAITGEHLDLNGERQTAINVPPPADIHQSHGGRATSWPTDRWVGAFDAGNWPAEETCTISLLVARTKLLSPTTWHTNDNVNSTVYTTIVTYVEAARHHLEPRSFPPTTPAEAANGRYTPFQPGLHRGTRYTCESVPAAHKL